MSPRLDSLCPIFLQRPGNQAVEQIGSAVLLNIGGEVILLSAAHVLDQREAGSISIPYSKNIRSIGGTLMSVGLPRGGLRSDDRVDIACIKLNRAAATDLHSRLRPLARADLALMDNLEMGDHYTFGGYPWRKSDYKNGVATTILTTFTGEATSSDVYERLGYSPQFHVVIRYRRKKSFSFRTGRREMAPLPLGVSGGGVFAWQKDIIQNPREPELLLCAVAHTYLASEALRGVATASGGSPRVGPRPFLMMSMLVASLRCTRRTAAGAISALCQQNPSIPSAATRSARCRFSKGNRGRRAD